MSSLCVLFSPIDCFELDFDSPLAGLPVPSNPFLPPSPRPALPPSSPPPPQVAKGRPWYIQPSCAMTGDGLVEGLDWLSEKLKARQGSSPPLPLSPPPSLPPSRPPRSSHFPMRWIDGSLSSCLVFVTSL